MPRVANHSEADIAERAEEMLNRLRNQAKNALGRDHELTVFLRDAARKASSMAANASTEPIGSSGA